MLDCKSNYFYVSDALGTCLKATNPFLGKETAVNVYKLYISEWMAQSKSSHIFTVNLHREP